MRILAVVLLSTALCVLPTTTGKQAHPSPPGLRDAQTQSNKPLEPPLEAKPKPLDLTKLKQEADELAQLSATVPSDVGFVAHGQLPKGLADKLKRIEKLAKHLRSEISE